MSLGDSPGDTSAPIMRDYRRLIFPEMLYETENIAHQKFDSVVCDARRLIAQVVTTHVGSDDVVSFAEHRQLMAPRIPELGKSMQKDHELVVITAALRIVQAYLPNLGVIKTSCPFVNCRLSLHRLIVQASPSDRA